ncbi:MAG: hypothetical protein AAGD96_26495 [Chloroflexota bacterium]
MKLRYKIQKDWLFYLFVISYLYIVGRMTFQLWFGSGVNIFASYSEVATAAELIVDANYVYWSKSTFLFLTIFLYAMNVDYRMAAGIGATFWALSLILMFSVTPTLIGSLLISVPLIVQQIWRKQIFQTQLSDEQMAYT